jgi:hypothetical protein
MRLIEDGKEERLDVFAPEYRPSLKRERRNRVGNGVEKQLSPCQRFEIGAAKDPHRGAIEKACACPPVRIVGDGKVILTGAPEADAIGAKALAIVVDDGRDDARLPDERRQSIRMTDAILQHGEARLRPAEPPQPWRG